MRESTRYPFEGTVELAVEPAAPVAFPLYLRVPGWCRSPRLALGGAVREIAGAGPYIRIERTWTAGDRVRLELPLEVRLRTWEKNARSVSVDRGPLTFSLRIAEERRRAGGTDAWPAW